MKAAKKRFHKKIPEFWDILKGESTLKDSTLLGYKGYRTIERTAFCCPYIPTFLHNKASK